MQIYKTKTKKFSGTEFREVHKPAFDLYTEINEKSNWRDRVRRMKYFGCAVELIQNSRFKPNSTKNPNVPNEMLYRFYGTTADNELFCVQIKENLKKKQKFLISVFPTDGPIFY